MRREKGLSQVVTTLILLVVAVLLAAVVTYYATNITMVRTETEALQLNKAHVWVNETGAVAGFKIQNLGGRDILIDKFSTRGVEEDWSSVYVYRVPSGTPVSGDINVTSYALLTGPSVDLYGKTYNMSTDDIPLISGGELLVYIAGPDNIQLDDLGTTVAISVFTNNAQYITEVNVESATPQ
jgi:flagellin-like protein